MSHASVLSFSFYVKNEGAAGGSKAVRIRRLNENLFPSASKLEAVGAKEKVHHVSVFA